MGGAEFALLQDSSLLVLSRVFGIHFQESTALDFGDGPGREWECGHSSPE